MKTKIDRLIALIFLIMMLMTNHLFAQSGQPKAADPTLEKARQKIDSLDKKLIEILGARERMVKKIGIYKAKKNIPSLQAARFQQVIDKGIQAGNKENLSPEFITEILNAIHKESLRIEDALKENK
ncbi:MAG: chorismate mutase [Bacteroidota bacterium]